MSMNREELIDLILDARTNDEISLAEREADAYLDNHPDDTGIAAACEQLEMMRGANAAVGEGA
jgi:hypothetical protein